MTRVILRAGMVALMLAAMSVWAEEPAKEVGDNASESGKNEILICRKVVPIDFVISQDYTEADRIEAVNKYEVTKRLEYAIACELERQGYVATKPIQVKGAITNFRLRAGASAMLGGIATGTDKLGIKVDVLMPGEDKPLQFSAGDFTSKGGFTMPAASQRLNYMVQKVAREVIEKIRKKGLFKEA